MSDETIYDAKGVLITEGARVLDPATGRAGGTVTKLEPLDVDVVNGHAHAIGPRVVVAYDDGTTESWLAQWNATGPWDDHRTDYTCDDVEVAL